MSGSISHCFRHYFATLSSFSHYAISRLRHFIFAAIAFIDYAALRDGFRRYCRFRHFMMPLMPLSPFDFAAYAAELLRRLFSLPLIIYAAC
jgi:hypothetical protein